MTNAHSRLCAPLVFILLLLRLLLLLLLLRLTGPVCAVRIGPHPKRRHTFLSIYRLLCCFSCAAFRGEPPPSCHGRSSSSFIHSLQIGFVCVPLRPCAAHSVRLFVHCQCHRQSDTMSITRFQFQSNAHIHTNMIGVAPSTLHIAHAGEMELALWLNEKNHYMDHVSRYIGRIFIRL